MIGALRCTPSLRRRSTVRPRPSQRPLTGATAEAMEAWISEGVARGGTDELIRLFRTNDRGHEVLAAEGYEFERTCWAKGSDEGWTERVMVVRSPLHANHQTAGL